MSNLNPQQFKLNQKYGEPRNSPFNTHPTRWELMKPSELSQYHDPASAAHDADPSTERYLGRMAEGIKKRGYRGADLDHSQHISLYHSDDQSYLTNGNHRVKVMNRIGYDKAVPVLVTDKRAK